MTDLNVETCKNSGCFRAPQFGNRCLQLFDDEISDFSSDIFACEVGRDFFTSGFTPLLKNNQIFQCQNNGNIQPVIQISPLFNEVIVNSTVCRDCCDSGNQLLDLADDFTPDDIGVSACEDSCESIDVDSCFLISNSRGRTGCLVALDISIQQSFNHENQTAFCNLDGTTTLAELTSFPSFSPTTSPTLLPTKPPTKSPTKSPTTSEEIITNSPTVLNEVVVEEVNNILPIIASVLGTMVVCLLLIIIIVLVLKNRKNDKIYILDSSVGGGTSAISVPKQGMLNFIKTSVLSGDSSTVTKTTDGRFPISERKEEVLQNVKYDLAEFDQDDDRNIISRPPQRIDWDDLDLEDKERIASAKPPEF